MKRNDGSDMRVANLVPPAEIEVGSLVVWSGWVGTWLLKSVDDSQAVIQQSNGCAMDRVVRIEELRLAPVKVQVDYGDQFKPELQVEA